MADRITPRLLGFSFYWAWTLLCFQSTVAFLPGIGIAAVLQNSATFFAASLVCCVLAHFGWAWVMQRRPSLMARTPWASAALMCASILYAGVWPQLGGTTGLLVAGAVSGVASAPMDLRWSQVYGEQRPDVSGRCITLSMALGIAIYFALCTLGQVIGPYACVLLVGVLPFACAWTLGLNFRAGEGLRKTVPPTHNARQIAGVLWRPVVGSLVFFFMFGFVKAVVGNHVDFNAAHGLSLLCGLTAVLALFACLRRGPRPSVGSVYGITMALVGAGFMALPLVMRIEAHEAGLFAASVLVDTGTTLFDTLLLCMIAHAAYDYRTSGAVVNGVVRGVTVGTSALGNLAGGLLAQGLWEGSVDIVAFVLPLAYLLILSASFFLGRRRLMAFPLDAADEGPLEVTPRAQSQAEADPSPAERAEQLEALLDRRVEDVAVDRHLSRRETEVLALLARGRSLPYMAETLVLSENTVRSHVRRIYEKLGVHSKQELIDLVEHAPDRDQGQGQGAL